MTPSTPRGLLEVLPGGSYAAPTAAREAVPMSHRQAEPAGPVPASDSPTSCLGRDAELARLEGLYAEAARWGERLVLVEGPSGVGKSALLKTFRSRVRLEGGVVLEGWCEPGRAFGPFAPIVDTALRFLDEVGAPASIEQSDLGCRAGCHRLWHEHQEGDGPEPPHRPGTNEALERRMRFFDAIDGLLRDVAAVRPPVVVLHDLERADHGTLELLEHLLDGSDPWADTPDRPRRTLIVASLRSDAPEIAAQRLRAHERSVHVEVGRLDEDGVRAYLQSREMVARVLARTGGDPEAIRLLVEADPLTPEDHLARQLAAVPPPARALLEALAVVDRPAVAELLATVADVRAGREERQAFAESELVARRIVDGRMLFSFAHERARERTYEQLPPERRRALHARCATLLTGRGGQAREAARHALAAGDVARAVPQALEAARSLAARHAHAEAAALLEEVLEAACHPAAIGGVGEAEAPDALQVRESLADLYSVAGDYRRALVHAQAVRQERPESAVAARREGELLTLAGRLDDAAEQLELAHRLAATCPDRSITVEVEVLLGELHYQRAAYGHARPWAERALEAACHLGEVRLEIQARNTLGKLALAQRDSGTAARLFEHNRLQASESALPHHEAQALTNLGVARLRRQELRGAEAAFSSAIEIAVGSSNTRERAIATENLAVLAHLRRDYANALHHYHDAVALLKRLGNRAMLARVANNLGELYLSLGETRRAGALCDFASQMGGAGLPPSVAGEGLLLRGRVEAACGDSDAARAAFESARSTFSDLGEARVADARLELIRTALAEGDVPTARGMLGGLPEPETAKRAAEIAVLHADAARASGDDPTRAASRAVEHAERAGDDELLLPALVRLARAHCDANALDAASRVFDRARLVEERLTARVPDESAEAWARRPVRLELDEVETLLEAAWHSAPSSPPPSTRTSTLPPPPRARPNDRRAELDERYGHIVGSSPAMSTTLQLLDKVAPTDALVLIRGESGTGKELIAEALHRNSPRRSRPMVKVNCAALVETLLLSELFGHERGAFTGASARKKGRFELADGGTLFLDEIGDISPKTQMALLRVLQEREFERVGGTQSIRVDVRIIAATHRDLEQMVREGTFREDLYYRLRGVMVEMPPLRERLSDVGELCERLLGRIAEERNEPRKAMSTDALAILTSHRWPGNVRELDNVLRSATLFAEGDVLVAQDFAAFADTFKPPEPAAVPPSDDGSVPEERLYQRIREGSCSLLDMKKEIERDCIARALAETDGNITRAATLLGMKRPRLSQLVKQHGLLQGEG